MKTLREEYASFLRPGRILLTGHSHQAWPDAAREAMSQAFDEAAEFVDDKWEHAVFPLIERVGRRVLERLGFDAGDAIVFGKSTHELGYRLLTSFGPTPRVLTTTGEFYSLTRQLQRLEEAGAPVRWVEKAPVESLAERLIAAIDSCALDLVCVSSVFFEDAALLPDLDGVLEAARARGVPVLVDAYHAFGAMELTWPAARENLFVVAGGYKYAQFGEGVCFMRIPKGCELRPVYTGWFADFGVLHSGSDARVGYGPDGLRFAGATFDPIGFYRARAVLDVFDRHGLTPARLREISVAQTELIVSLLDAAGVPVLSPRDPSRRGGFVTAHVKSAGDVVKALRGRGVVADARGEGLRFGPAPYLEDREIREGVAIAVALIGA